MGLFNTLLVDAICINCSSEITLPIQFKYGFARQLQYRLGDSLDWRSKDEEKPWLVANELGNVGSSEFRNVIASGIAEDCPHCGQQALENEDLYVVIKDNVIDSVRESDYSYTFKKAPYEVLDVDPV